MSTSYKSSHLSRVNWRWSDANKLHGDGFKSQIELEDTLELDETPKPS